MKWNLTAKFSSAVVLFLAMTLLPGCKTPPPVDWDSRVGNYTYEQAVAELGQPDRQIILSDGKTVYKWYVRPHVGPALNTGMSYYGSTGFSAGQNIGSGSNEMLKLTFGTDGKLAAWSKN